MPYAPASSPAAPPADGSVSEDRTTPTQEIGRLFTLQQTNTLRLRHTTAAQRAEKLRRLHTMVLDYRSAIQDALFADFRKPAIEVDTSEIAAVAEEATYAAKHVARWMAPERVSTPPQLVGSTSEIRYEPKGQALVLAPWNYPLNLALNPVVAAIAAGCPVLLKPSEHTPYTSRLLREMVQATFAESEVAVVEGAVETAEYLLEQPFDHIFFTGSSKVGRLVMKAAAEHLSSVTLELGGKSPTIVDRTADLKKTARRIALGKFTNAGQTCIAPDYVYVHADVHDAFIEALQDTVTSFYGETVAERARTLDYGRIVNAKHHERLQSLYSDAVAKGAQTPVGTGLAGEGQFIDPTVLTHVPLEAEIMQDEIFGPLLPVLSYRSLQEPIDLINSKPKPLALYVFTGDDAVAEHVINHTSAGGTTVNNVFLHYLNPALPFGGVNNSGLGKYHGEAGFRAFSNARAVVRQRNVPSAMDLLTPPYTFLVRRAVDLALKVV